MAYLKENQQEILAENQSVGKRQGPQDQREPVIKS